MKFRGAGRHYINADGAVNVDVNETRKKRQTSEIENRIDPGHFNFR
jgi:hypothetical protein